MSALIGGLLGLVRDTVETKNKTRTEALQLEKEKIAAQVRQAQIQADAQVQAAQAAAKGAVDAAKEASKGKSKE